MVVNPRAAHGRSATRWKALQPALRARLGTFAATIPPTRTAARETLWHALQHGEHHFVAVGGDGTVNALLNDLLAVAEPAAYARLSIGAIGLGSSNDFHKPVAESRMIDGVPVRLGFARSMIHDVVRTDLVTDGWRTVRHWLVNASIGITATGNHVYNRHHGAIAVLKRWNTSAGMVGAAAFALVRARPLTLTIRSLDGVPRTVWVTNLGIVKNPHFTGSLRYPTRYAPADGQFVVHLLNGSTRAGTLAAIAGLARGRFGGPGTATWQTRRLSVAGETPFALEMDGEVQLVSRAVFRVVPFRIRLAS